MRIRPDQFPVGGDGVGKGAVQDGVVDRKVVEVNPSTARTVRLLVIWGALWVAPVLLVASIFGSNNVFLPIAGFFSKMAVVTFGGAYAVLAYVAQLAVETYGWLQAGEMLDGLDLA